MNAVPMSAVRADFAHIVNRVAFGNERFVVQRNGKGLVAIVSIADLELLRLLEDAADVRAARRSLAEVKKAGAVAWSDVKAEADRKGGRGGRLPRRTGPRRAAAVQKT